MQCELRSEPEQTSLSSQGECASHPKAARADALRFRGVWLSFIDGMHPMLRVLFVVFTASATPHVAEQTYRRTLQALA